MEAEYSHQITHTSLCPRRRKRGDEEARLVLLTMDLDAAESSHPQQPTVRPSSSSPPTPPRSCVSWAGELCCFVVAG
ncbi:hypothetical protein E2562_010917 [Oryza meyeriana var. granulata]|uniref:Uncharacterized protein n=1 Tax=Oryza meyeriana var. granulata TaxID=110450 RepID=A0A6G1BWF9_9ORYZ|nr:hypothetical protein E2562_010917 [Oryza meyeriana var. granulata]